MKKDNKKYQLIEKEVREQVFNELYKPSKPEIIDCLNKRVVAFTIMDSGIMKIQSLLLLSDNTTWDSYEYVEDNTTTLSEADRHIVDLLYDNYISGLINEKLSCRAFADVSVSEYLRRYISENHSEMCDDTLRNNLYLLYKYVWQYFSKISITKVSMMDIYRYVNVEMRDIDKKIVDSVLYLLRPVLVKSVLDTIDGLMGGAHAVHDYDLKRDSQYKLPCGIDKQS